MICEKCKTDAQPVKSCAICCAEFCRHDARRQPDGSIVCLEPFDCIKRVGRAVNRSMTAPTNEETCTNESGCRDENSGVRTAPCAYTCGRETL